MQSKQRVSRSAGFTLVELLVVLAILAIGMGLGIPALHNFIVRHQTEGFARETSMLLQRARLEAIKSNREVAVFLDGDALVAFVDADSDDKIEPDPSAPYKTADWEVGRSTLPDGRLFLKAPSEAEGGPIDGFDKFGGVTSAVFRPNGSVAEDGAFRIADQRDNFLEVRVAPAATARIEVRKWQDGAWLGTGDPSDPDFIPWTWK